MNSSTPSIVYVRKGKTTANNVRSCDTVRAGAFCPQVQLQVPQKEMRQHRRQHMVVPAGIFAHFIMGHPELRFAFFKALLNGLTLQRQLIYSLATLVLGGRCTFAILAHSDALQLSLDLHPLLPRRRLPHPG